MAIIDCALNTSFPLDCKNSKGGIKKIGFAVFSDVLSMDGASAPTNASGIITAWSGAAGKFYMYAVRSSIATGSNKRTTNKANGTTFSAPALTTQLEKLNAATSQELKKLEGNRVFAIVYDRNGKIWLMGAHNGMDVTEINEEFGTAMGDFNGYKITLAGEEEQPMYELRSGIVAALFT